MTKYQILAYLYLAFVAIAICGNIFMAPVLEALK